MKDRNDQFVYTCGSAEERECFGSMHSGGFLEEGVKALERAIGSPTSIIV